MQWKHSSSPRQRRLWWCHRQGRWWPPSSGMQRALYYVTTCTFRKAKLSMENTMATCWGSCERQSSQKQPGKLMKGVLLHQNNAPAHKSVVAMAAVCDCGFELNNYPPYYPDLASSNFCSPTWKNTWLGSSVGLMMRSYQQFRTFSRIRMRASIPQESKRCNTDYY